MIFQILNSSRFTRSTWREEKNSPHQETNAKHKGTERFPPGLRELQAQGSPSSSRSNTALPRAGAAPPLATQTGKPIQLNIKLAPGRRRRSTPGNNKQLVGWGQTPLGTTCRSKLPWNPSIGGKVGLHFGFVRVTLLESNFESRF